MAALHVEATPYTVAGSYTIVVDSTPVDEVKIRGKFESSDQSSVRV